MKILNEMTGQEMFFLLAGPCVIEGEEMALKIAEHVSELTDKWGIPYVFKDLLKRPTAPVWILLQELGMKRL